MPPPWDAQVLFLTSFILVVGWTLLPISMAVLLNSFFLICERVCCMAACIALMLQADSIDLVHRALIFLVLRVLKF